MTIILGIIAENTIIIASDSQTTAGSSKRTDTNKITELTLDGIPVLIAESGDAVLSGAVVEKLQASFSSLKFDDYRKPVDAAQNAIAELRRQIAQGNTLNNPNDLGPSYFDENSFSLMMAYFYKRPNQSATEPFLYTLDSVTAGYGKREKHFAAIGCGASTAEFILGRCDATKLELPMAVTTAVYVVEEVKKVDTFCGGPTKLAVIGEKSVLYSETEAEPLIKSVIEAIQNAEPELKKKWAELFELLHSKAAFLYAKMKSDDKETS